jgi:FkbM family methyltransferase
MSLQSILQRQMRHVGLEVRKYAPESSLTATLTTVCRRQGIDLVLDVGASIGQFAGDLRAAGYQEDLVSFEPLPDAWEALSRAAARDPRWTVHPRCALGDREGHIDIHVAANSVSSSALPMLESHRSAAPESAYQGTVSVPLHRLDDAVGARIEAARATLLKIDTQGFEWQVLDGAPRSLARVRAIALELSVLPLYDGQRLWQDLIARLEGEGFDLWSLHPGFADKDSGRVLQYDGLFCRR